MLLRAERSVVEKSSAPKLHYVTSTKGRKPRVEKSNEATPYKKRKPVVKRASLIAHYALRIKIAYSALEIVLLSFRLTKLPSMPAT